MPARRGQPEFFVFVGKLRWVRSPLIVHPVHTVHPVKFDPSGSGESLSNAEDWMCMLHGMEAWTVVYATYMSRIEGTSGVLSRVVIQRKVGHTAR